MHRKDASHRSLQPTFRYEHPYLDRFPRSRLAPRSPPPKCTQSVSPAITRSAASDHLAAIRPRVELRLTARLQLRTNQSLSLVDLIKEEMSPARRQGFPGVALSAAPRADDPASDAPCRAPQTPIAERIRSARTASTALASTRAAFPIRGAFHRQVALFTAFAERARHRSRSFAAASRLPALFRSSRLLSQGRARSRRW